MKITKKISLLFLVVAMVLSFSSGVFAQAITENSVYKIDEIALEMTLPEGTYVFTSETEPDDPLWAEAGIDNVDYVMDEFKDLEPHALLTANDGETRIYIMSTNTEATQGYYNLSYMDEADLYALANRNNFEDEVGSGTSALYETDDLPFIELTMHLKTKTGDDFYEYDFYTIVNGYSVTFCQPGSEPISDISVEYAKNLINNLSFSDTYLTTEGMTNEELREAYIAVFVLILLVIAIIVGLVYLSSKRKKEKDFSAKLAKNLSEFRLLREESPPELGDVLFENTTEITDFVIKLYSHFICYVDKKIQTIIMYLLWLLVVVVMIVTNAQWWLIAALVAVMAFTLYKHFISGATLEKSLKKSYKKIRNRIATFRFYQNEFSISGIEPGQFHPYFQITHLKEDKDHLYFFFGENNPYILDKKNFTKGEVLDFKQFISTKTGRNFK